MALSRARPGEVIDLRPLCGRLIETPSRALLRTGSIELMQLILLAGECIPAHAVDATTTLHVLEGRVRLDLGSSQPTLVAGSLVLVEAGVRHTVEALQDASLLVTMLLPHDGCASRTSRRRFHGTAARRAPEHPASRSGR